MAGIPYPALPLADVCFSYFLGFSALKGNGLPASILSLLLHGWAPAGFLRGFCRLAVSIGIVMEKGKRYQEGKGCTESQLDFSTKVIYKSKIRLKNIIL